MELIAIGISSISLLVSIIAVVFTNQLSKKANEISEVNLNLIQKANEISEVNLNLNHGMLELELRQSIGEATTNLSKLSIEMAPLKVKEENGGITEEERKVLDIFSLSLTTLTQTLLNAYDNGCAKYIDDKIDKDRFKKSFHFEVRNLLASESLKEFFHPTTTRYKAILKVYNEWENLEV